MGLPPGKSALNICIAIYVILLGTDSLVLGTALYKGALRGAELYPAEDRFDYEEHREANTSWGVNLLVSPALTGFLHQSPCY